MPAKLRLVTCRSCARSFAADRALGRPPDLCPACSALLFQPHKCALCQEILALPQHRYCPPCKALREARLSQIPELAKTMTRAQRQFFLSHLLA